MIFTTNVLNFRLYVNLSGGPRVITVAVSGAANIEVKAPNGAVTLRQPVTDLGTVVSLPVPAQHIVEVDAPNIGVQVEVQGTI